MLNSGVEIYPDFCLTVDLRDLPVVLAVGAVLAAAQIFLSRREKWWPGLILPGLWLFWTLVDILPQLALRISDGFGWFWGVTEFGLTALVFENIPTLFLLTIYLVCYTLQRRKRKKQLKKTRIDDL